VTPRLACVSIGIMMQTNEPVANTFDFKCPRCGALYSKGLRRDDDANYGEGISLCEVCGGVMEKWNGFEPVYVLVNKLESR
jgi:predicted RNA-binding Zn-ribbon protein involved in translation (DUF1610 family)